MINWKAKLTSRKLWLAVAEFVGMLLLVVFGVAEETIEKVVALIMAGAGALGYILAEGLVDAKNAGSAVIEDVLIGEPVEDERPAEGERSVMLRRDQEQLPRRPRTPHTERARRQSSAGPV